MKTTELSVALIVFVMRMHAATTWPEIMASLRSNDYADFSMVANANALPLCADHLQQLSYCLSNTNTICVTNNEQRITMQRSELAVAIFEHVAGLSMTLGHDLAIRGIMSGNDDQGALVREHFLELSMAEMNLAKLIVEAWLEGYCAGKDMAAHR
jgi:hypothetical protein